MVADRTIRVRIQADVEGLQRGFARAADATRNAEASTAHWVQANRDGINEMSGKIGLLGGALTGLAALAVKKFMEFDKAMSAVAATGEEARASLGDLKQAALDAGQASVYSATEAANAIENLAKAGVSTSDILGGALTASLDLAAAGELEVADAAELAATVMNQFGIEGADAARIADVLSATAGKAAGDVEDVGLAMKYVGPVAAQLGVSLEETSGTLALLAQNGLLADSAGTGLRGVLMSLTAPSSEAQKAMDRYNISAFDAQGNFVGLADLAGQLHTKLGDLSEAERSAALGQMFGNQQITTARILYANGADAVNKWTTAVGDSGYASETAATRLDNLAGDWEALSGSLETALIGMGEGADTPLRSLTQKLTGIVNVFNELPDGAKSATMAIAGGGGLALLGVAALGKLATSLASTRAALVSLGVQRAHVNAVAGGLTRMAGAGVGIVAVAAGVGTLVTALKSGEATRGANAITKSVEDLAESGNIEDINAQFQDFGSILGASVSDVDSLGSALDQMLDMGFTDKFLTDPLGGMLPGVTTYIEVVEDRFKSLDDTLSQMASGGNAEAAAKAFDVIEKAAGEQGYTVEQLMGLFPQYKDALIGVEKEADKTADVTDDTASAIDTLAASTAEGTDSTEEYTDALKELVDQQLEASGAVLDTRQAQRDYQAAIDDAATALKKNGETLDKHTEKGRENADALDGIAKAGLDVIESQKKQGKSADVLKGTMKNTRQEFINTATDMGMSEDAAKDLADQMNLIPKNLDVDVAVHTSAAHAAINELIRKAGSLRNALVVSAGGPRPSAPGVELPTKAGGGAISGPGTGTSDSVAALLSNGEHVWTAAEVQQAGGHGAVARMRAAVRGGLLRLASGGPVSHGHSLAYWDQRRASALELTQMRIRIRDLKHDLRETEKTKNGTRQVLRGLDRRRANQELAQAQKELDEAKVANAINRSRKGTIATRIRRSEQAQERRDARAQRATEQRELSRQVRRGEVVDAVTGGLSGAYGVVDEVREAARNAKSGKSRDRLNKAANDAEKNLKKLYKQADGIDKKLESATNQVEELASIKASTSSVLASGYSLGDSVAGAVQRDGKGNVWYGNAGKSIVGGAVAYAAKVKAFGSKLSQLQKKGFAGVILQEVAALGVEEGTKAADALLALSASDTKTLNQAYTDIQTYSDQAGQYVTEGFYDGGLAAAEGVVDGLEAKRADIEAEIASWGVALQKALLDSLGLKLNKQGKVVKKARGGWVTGGTAGADSVPHLLTPGEFVVNATAAKGNAGALEWINGGGGARQATGGGAAGFDGAALAAAFTGMTFVLDVDGQPIRAVARVEAAGVLNKVVRATRAGVRS
jgi:TP901 family phage tail tape measure protein